MPANTSPIFPEIPVSSWCTLTAANTAMDGTGTVGLAFVAGADGARVDEIVCKALGSNVATVARVYVNNGTTNTVAANNSLIAEIALPATTAASDAKVSAEHVLPINRSLPAGYKINIVIGTAVAAGWQFTTAGGDY